MTTTNASRLPDNVGIALAALAALAAALVAPVIIALFLAGPGGSVWIAVPPLLFAGVAVFRALKLRLGTAQVGHDTRHRLSEGTRSTALVSLLWTGGVLVLNAATSAFGASGP
jgi:hypothetical protein